MFGLNATAIALSLVEKVPEQYRFLVYLAVAAIVITIYVVFVWKFYRFLAKKDIVEIHLWEYIKTEHNILKKFFASILYLVEYIIVMPFLVFFWYLVFCVFLLFLAREQSIANVLLIGMAIVAAVRISAYLSEDLSKDVAKLLPFTLLAFFILTPGFFSFAGIFDRIKEIPSFFRQILYYIIFVVALEFIMRLFTVIYHLFSPAKEVEEGEEKEGGEVEE